MHRACPIVCKVADFGLSRSLMPKLKPYCIRAPTISTYLPWYSSLYGSRNSDWCFNNSNPIQSGSMKMDIWSLGILAHAMMNPNLSTPYSKEVEKLSVQFDKDMMKHFMQIQRLPSNDTKYEFHVPHCPVVAGRRSSIFHLHEV